MLHRNVEICCWNLLNDLCYSTPLLLEETIAGLVIYMNGEVLPGIPGTTGELTEFLPGGNPPYPYDTSVGRGENNTLGIIFERGKITN